VVTADAKVKAGAKKIGNQGDNFEDDGQLISNARLRSHPF